MFYLILVILAAYYFAFMKFNKNVQSFAGLGEVKVLRRLFTEGGDISHLVKHSPGVREDLGSNPGLVTKVCAL